jgi:DNA-binding response OmpR family regulator
VQFDDGTRAELSEREADLLAYLAENADRAIGRDEILSRVWHLNPARFQTRTIDMHVARLRDKLRDDRSAPAVIATVRGKGYKLGHGVKLEGEG